MRSSVIAVATLMIALPASAGGGVDFNREIRPVLADRCFACHGPDAGQRKGKLRLDLEDEAKKSVIVPGRPEASELFARITSSDDSERMPPPESHKPALSAAEVDAFRRWIAEGAPWTQHWAFVPVTAPAPPLVQQAAWSVNDLDRFVLARLEAEGLRPAPEADRATLLRRISFDLIGLPPTPEEVDAFEEDTRPDAYEAAIDRLMSSPHYGERMALDWLDGARYADTNGYQNDFQRMMWPWRDWVIRAFNENMPFDQFTVEQIAGDLLPGATESQRIATGFCRNNRSNTEGGAIEEEWYIENRVDRVETVSAVFLGLTMGCARCHDHKYDPISQREFYEFLGFFNSTADKGFYEETRGNSGPTVSLPTPEHKEKLASFDERIARATRDLEEARKSPGASFDAWRGGLAASAQNTPPSPLLAFPLRGDLLAIGSDAPTYAGAGGPVWKEGLLGPALELDGTAEAHLDAGQALKFQADKAFSVTAWIRPEAAGSVFSKMDDADGFRGVDLLLGGEGEFAVHVVHRWNDNAVKVIAERKLEFGAWAHVAVTYDGSSKAAGIKAYVNGYAVPLKTEVDALSAPVDTAEPLRIGRRSSGAFYRGGLTALAFHDRVLSAEEIGETLNAELGRTLAGEVTPECEELLRRFHEAQDKQRLKRFEDRLNGFNRDRAEYLREKVPSVMVMEELPESRPTYRLIRGQYDLPDTSEALEPGLPAFLPPLPEGAPRNRLSLARWLVDPGNPLTARVAVNRLWTQFFGQGLVKTPDNLGMQSEPPTHPELLDWLAGDFVANGWDVKRFQKQILMSATYRQRSAATEELIARDPENRLLARGPRFRLHAELIRDSALAASGLLSPTIGGPSVKPYQPEGLWAELAGGAGEGPYIQSTGEDLYRRSLYTYRKRTVSHPTVSTFDAPSWEICRVYRARTNTPLQALALLNDTTYVEAARHLAGRMLEEPRPRVREQVRHGFRLVTGRYPTDAEEELLLSGLRGYLETFGDDRAAAEQFISHGDSPAPAAGNPARLAAFTAVAGVLLNMDAAITKE